MAYISCSVSSCSNNKSGSCYASSVNIGGKGATSECDTCCGSYLNSTVYSNNCTLNGINVGSSTNAKYYTETECLSFEQ